MKRVTDDAALPRQQFQFLIIIIIAGNIFFFSIFVISPLFFCKAPVYFGQLLKLSASKIQPK